MDRPVLISPAKGVEQSLRDRLSVAGPLLWLWTRRELRARYRQSTLRGWWSLPQPVLLLATYGWVLTVVLDVSGDAGVPYLTFAWAGIVPFTFFAQALSQGVGSIQQAGPLVSRVWFPREVLPASVVMVSFVDLLVMTGILLVVVWWQVGPPGVHLFGLVPVFAMMAMWTTGLTLLAASLNVVRRDVAYGVPLALRVLFIVTPVMYPASLVERHVPGLVRLNPIAVAVEGVRDSVYRATWPSPGPLVAQLVAGAVVLVASFAAFRRIEPTMGDRL